MNSTHAYRPSSQPTIPPICEGGLAAGLFKPYSPSPVPMDPRGHIGILRKGFYDYRNSCAKCSEQLPRSRILNFSRNSSRKWQTAIAQPVDGPGTLSAEHFRHYYESTWMLPPWRSTISSETHSPWPVSTSFVVVKMGSKIYSL